MTAPTPRIPFHVSFSDTVPAAPAAKYNVKWQYDLTTTPISISAYVDPAGFISGTADYVAKFTGADSLGNSSFLDDGVSVYPFVDNTNDMGAEAHRWRAIYGGDTIMTGGYFIRESSVNRAAVTASTNQLNVGDATGSTWNTLAVYLSSGDAAFSVGNSWGTSVIGTGNGHASAGYHVDSSTDTGMRGTAGSEVGLFVSGNKVVRALANDFHAIRGNIYVDTDNDGVIFGTTESISAAHGTSIALAVASAVQLTIDATNGSGDNSNTPLLIHWNSTSKRVIVGPADSAGSGYRALKILN